jgi:hypothetical protein
MEVVLDSLQAAGVGKDARPVITHCQVGMGEGGDR